MTSERQQKIETLRQFPVRLSSLVTGLSEAQLDRPCGEGEWTIRQVVHHLADSHMNSLIRLKLILTEDNPALKPYNQEAWAALPDTAGLLIEASLRILEGLHHRWVTIFDSLEGEQWSRGGTHPEIGQITPDDLLTIYEQHCKEHLAQIQRGLGGN